MLGKGDKKKGFNRREITLKVRKALFDQNHKFLNILRSMMVDGIRFCEEKRIDGQVIFPEEYIFLKEAYVGCFVRRRIVFVHLLRVLTCM